MSLPKLPTRWIVARPADLAGSPPPDKFSPLILQLLANRGITGGANIAAFLEPKLSDLVAPDLLPHCIDAAMKVVAAIRAGRKIVVYGDYDVDGTTGAAILWHAMKLAGSQPGLLDYYVPHRLDEGYGLNGEALASIARDGATMVVTVDCGITAVNEAEIARALGIELIITDHHEPTAQLPAAACIVHPGLDGSYPNPRLCGAGVAMKVAWAIGQTLSAAEKVGDAFRQFLLQAVSLAALGTVADVVPLVGENRAIVAYGLRSIKKTGLPGLDALIDSAGLRAEKVDAYHVGFTLAPRLNAAGRMDQARQVVELFTEADAQRGRELADDLVRHNRERQATEQAILRDAIALIEADAGFSARRSIVLSGDWHPGVIGIVASRLVDRYNRPTVMIGIQNGVGHGSARSIDLPTGPGSPTFSINDALASCKDLLISFGGHAMAGGLRIEQERIKLFVEAFECAVADKLTEADLAPTLLIDAEVTANDLRIEIVRQMAALAPFGAANPAPVLVARSCRLANEPRRVGRDGAHLQFHVRIGNAIFKAIAFRGADWSKPLSSGRPFDIAFEPSINTYQGRSNVELTVCDIQWNDQKG